MGDRLEEARTIACSSYGSCGSRNDCHLCSERIEYDNSSKTYSPLGFKGTTQSPSDCEVCEGLTLQAQTLEVQTKILEGIAALRQLSKD